MTKDFNLQPFVDELSLGTIYGVFIDDSGSPGWQPRSPDPSLPYPIGDSWVAVIVPAIRMPTILRELKAALETVRQRFQVEEFHSSEIYSGRGVFKNVDLESRFRLFSSMAKLLRRHKVAVIVQTLDPNSTLLQRDNMPTVLRPCWDLQKPKDMAFITLLWRVEKYLTAEKKKCAAIKARVFVDEGYEKSGAAISGFPAFTENSIYFADSALVPPLQLADFVAFTVNRHQLLATKDSFSPTDVLFLRITSVIARNLENVELKPARIKPSGGPNPIR